MPRWIGGALLVTLLSASHCAASELQVRGFHLGMSIVEADAAMKSEFGKELVLGPALEFGSFFSASGNGCYMYGGAIGMTATQFHKRSRLPGIERRTVNGDEVLDNIRGRTLNAFRALKVSSLQILPCLFGLQNDDKRVLDVFSRKVTPLPASCRKPTYADEDQQFSYCYLNRRILISVIQNKKTTAYTHAGEIEISLTDTQLEPNAAANARKYGVVPPR